MDNQRFKTLAEKYLAGNAAPEEEQELMHYYKLLQKRYPRWDAEAMGDKDRLEKELLNSINDRIGPQGGRWNPKRLLIAAASVIILTASASMIWQYRLNLLNYIDPVKALSAVTAPEELKEIQLSDGSRIWLNAGSELRYPEKFRDSLRSVYLKGEAYFEIAPNAEKPFIVHSGELVTRVVGTTFNIAAYTGEKQAIVTVLSGKVAVADTAFGRNNLLQPKQELIYDRTNQGFTAATAAHPEDAIRWKENDLEFSGTSMNAVITVLQRWYHVSIAFDNELGDCPVFIDFTGMPLNQALELLAASFRGNLSLEKKDHYYINGKKCE